MDSTKSNESSNCTATLPTQPAYFHSQPLPMLVNMNRTQAPNATVFPCSLAGVTGSTELGDAYSFPLPDTGDGGSSNSVASEWEAAMRFLHLLAMYYVPPVLAVGMLGNPIVAFFLLRSPLARQSSSHHLAAVALADTAFLGSVFMIWIKVLGVDLYNRKGLCQFMSFVSSLCSFLPLWYTVAFAADRAQLHYAHSKRLAAGGGLGGHVYGRHSNSRTFYAKIVIIGILVVGVVIHVNTSLTVGVLEFPDFEKCMVLTRFIPYLNWFSLVDGFINIIIPYSTIALALAVIAWSECHARKSKGDVSSRSANGNSSSVGSASSRDPLDYACYRLTALTCVLLSLFFLTRLPWEVFRLVNIVRNFSEALPHPEPHEFLYQQLTHRLVLLSYALKAPACVLFHPGLCRACKRKLSAAGSTVGALHLRWRKPKQLVTMASLEKSSSTLAMNHMVLGDSEAGGELLTCQNIGGGGTDITAV